MLRIRSLKIQRRRRGSRGGKNTGCHSNGVNNNNNLIMIKSQSMHPTRNLENFHLGQGNTRSVRNKTELLHDHITKYKYDAFVITETWLKDTEKR